MSSKIYTKYATFYKKRGTDISSKLNSIAEEIFSGISTVKAFAQEEKEKKYFES